MVQIAIGNEIYFCVITLTITIPTIMAEAAIRTTLETVTPDISNTSAGEYSSPAFSGERNDY